MSEEQEHKVAYIASAPEELKVGDRVEVVDADTHRLCYIGFKGHIVENPNPTNGCFRVRVGDGTYSVDFKPEWLRKISETDNVTEFNRILQEMADTYKAKDSTYGNAYEDGYRRFGAVQLVSRMYEKYCRIENLLIHNADNKVPDESVLDTLTDLSVQAICLRMLLAKNDFENVK